MESRYKKKTQEETLSPSGEEKNKPACSHRLRPRVKEDSCEQDRGRDSKREWRAGMLQQAGEERAEREIPKLREQGEIEAVSCFVT